jgi:phospholipid-binding lipoprotein MlaA
MKILFRLAFLFVLLLPLLFPLTGCAAAKKNASKTPAAVGNSSTSSGKAIAPSQIEDDLTDDYPGVRVFDPLEALNRATFMLNHGIYTVIFKPVAKTYKFIVPKPVRSGVHNVYENIEFPRRLVNHSLQGRFDRAGQETGRFLLDSTVGIAGWFRPSKKFPALADIPDADTGQTFAKWGIGHGPYLVLPILGPSSSRDLIGLAGDYALNPVNWTTFAFGGAVWVVAITTPNTVRSLPDQMDRYDAVTKDALDRYLAARTAYIQYRDAAAKR